MYVDLVEALGTFEEAREVYDRMIDSKVASAQAILNYADFLKQQKFWEDAFQVYEKGIANFRYPHVERIWKAYLTAFVDRHKGSKVERARDLFTQVRCASVPQHAQRQSCCRAVAQRACSRRSAAVAAFRWCRAAPC